MPWGWVRQFQARPEAQNFPAMALVKGLQLRAPNQKGYKQSCLNPLAG